MTGASKEYPCEKSDLCLKPLLRRAYGLFWDHAKLLVAAHLAILVVLVIGNQLLMVGGNVLLGPFFLGLYKINLRIARNEDTEFSDILSGFEYFLPAFVANILIHIASIVGGVLVIPGLIALLTYAATYLFILDQKMGFWDAMEGSRRIVWGNFKRWAVLGLMILLVNLTGVLCFGIGLLVTLPFSHLLITLAYEDETEARRQQDSAPLEIVTVPDTSAPAAE